MTYGINGDHEADKIKQDYFRRLKFTYLEQEAKREFLDSITGDEPKGARPGENEERGEQRVDTSPSCHVSFRKEVWPLTYESISEQINARKKAALKTTKAEVDEMRETALRLAQENATSEWSCHSARIV